MKLILLTTLNGTKNTIDVPVLSANILPSESCISFRVQLATPKAIGDDMLYAVEVHIELDRVLKSLNGRVPKNTPLDTECKVANLTGMVEIIHESLAKLQNNFTALKEYQRVALDGLALELNSKINDVRQGNARIGERLGAIELHSAESLFGQVAAIVRSIAHLIGTPFSRKRR